MSNTASDHSPHPELQEVKMKVMAVMIAALSLISTTWAQGQHTENGRKSDTMLTDLGDFRVVGKPSFTGLGKSSP